MRFSVKDFPPYTNLLLETADTGLVIIQGENGSGKSSILEAYCTTLWAKSLRGAAPWRGKCDLRLDLPTISVHRTEKTLQVNQQEALKPTKKKPELLSLIGPWDLFCRTRVFDADLTARFGASGDAERKRLLEKLCGLEQLEEAGKLCRSDLRKLEQDHFGLISQRSRLESALGERPKIETPNLQELEKLKTQAAGLQIETNALMINEGMAVGKIVELERRSKALKASLCHLCGATVTPEQRSVLAVDTQAMVIARDQFSVQRKQKEILQRDIRVQLQTLANQQAAANEYQKSQSRRQEIEHELEAVQQKLQQHDKTKGVHESVNEFISSSRPRLLQEILGGLEATVTNWVSLLSDQPFKMWVEGEGLQLKLGERSYKELNRGHRRRIDLAILLAISQLQQTETRHPLFLDECLDGVDRSGCESMATILEAVADKELVVLFTHSEELAGHLSGQKLKVHNGQLTDVSKRSKL